MNDDEIRIFKKKLRFKIGDNVYLKSDKKKNTVMTVTGYCSPDDDMDYVIKWLNSQKTMECTYLPDATLTT